MAPRGGQAPPRSAETGSVVPMGTLGRFRGSEPGPLVVVLGYLRDGDADRLASREAAQHGGTATRIGLGVQLPAGPFGLQFDTWLHVYATTQPSGLSAALAAVADGRCTCPAERGEHPHTARGCDIAGCGCRWVPPPITDTEEDTDGI